MNWLNTKALIISTHTSIWLIVVMTIVSEKVPAFKSFLAGLTGHHWTTKGVISLAVFFIVLLIFSKAEEPENPLPLVKGVVWSVVLGGAVIFGFYLLHFNGLV